MLTINMFTLLAPFKLYAIAGGVLIVAGILGVHLHHDRGVRIARDTAISNLASYKSQQKVLTDAAMIEKAKAEASSKLKIEQAVKASNELLAKFNLANIDRNQLTEKVRLLNASINQNEAVAARTRANLNASVRLSASRDSTAASKESSAASQLSTADSHFATFRDACRVTTIDLVKSYAIIEADTLACGRKSN